MPKSGMKSVASGLTNQAIHRGDRSAFGRPRSRSKLHEILACFCPRPRGMMSAHELQTQVTPLTQRSSFCLGDAFARSCCIRFYSCQALGLDRNLRQRLKGLAGQYLRSAVGGCQQRAHDIALRSRQRQITPESDAGVPQRLSRGSPLSRPLA